jgi:hypothetical protein
LPNVRSNRDDRSNSPRQREGSRQRRGSRAQREMDRSWRDRHFYNAGLEAGRDEHRIAQQNAEQRFEEAQAIANEEDEEDR